MDLADQLAKLHSLHESGALSDEEFAAAKKKLLEPHAALPSDHLPRVGFPEARNADQSLGRAANRYMNMRITMAIVGAIVFLFFLFGVFLPAANRMNVGFPH